MVDEIQMGATHLSGGDPWTIVLQPTAPATEGEIVLPSAPPTPGADTFVEELRIFDDEHDSRCTQALGRSGECCGVRLKPCWQGHTAVVPMRGHTHAMAAARQTQLETPPRCCGMGCVQRADLRRPRT